MQIADPRERERLLGWSQFRRVHQAVAQQCHMRRREKQTMNTSAPSKPQIISLPETVALSDEPWERIQSLLPPQKPAIGRPAHDHRRVLQGILWVARTGAPWREVPRDFGPWETIHSRYRRWRKEGRWQRIVAALHATTPDEPTCLVKCRCSTSTTSLTCTVTDLACQYS